MDDDKKLERMIFQRKTLEYKIRYLQNELKSSKENLKSLKSDIENHKVERQLGLFDDE